MKIFTNYVVIRKKMSNFAMICDKLDANWGL